MYLLIYPRFDFAEVSEVVVNLLIHPRQGYSGVAAVPKVVALENLGVR